MPVCISYTYIVFQFVLMISITDISSFYMKSSLILRSIHLTEDCIDSRRNSNGTADHASVKNYVANRLERGSQTNGEREVGQEGDGSSAAQKQSTLYRWLRVVVRVIATTKCLFCKG